MKKLMIVSCLAVCGCATSTQVDALSKQLETERARSAEVENRLARIEKDLYKIEVKKAPEREEVVREFRPAEEVAPNVVDTRIRAFLKEYAGFAFGDPNPNQEEGRSRRRRRYGEERDLIKKFQYFDKASVGYTHNKATSIRLYCKIDSKYSYETSCARMKQVLSDLAVTWGLSSDYFDSWDEKNKRCKNEKERAMLRARLETEVKPTLQVYTEGFGRTSVDSRTYCYEFSISIRDAELSEKIQADSLKVGEGLPEIQ